MLVPRKVEVNFKMEITKKEDLDFINELMQNAMPTVPTDRLFRECNVTYSPELIEIDG